jgi:hypothetical protein
MKAKRRTIALSEISAYADSDEFRQFQKALEELRALNLSHENLLFLAATAQLESNVSTEDLRRWLLLGPKVKQAAAASRHRWLDALLDKVYANTESQRWSAKEIDQYVAMQREGAQASGKPDPNISGMSERAITVYIRKQVTIRRFNLGLSRGRSRRTSKD